MTKKILVSRHQLTECPACLAHIQITEDWARALCPFCGASLAASARRDKVDLFEALRAVQSSTGGLMAASLIGLGLVACEADTGLLDGSPTDTGSTIDSGVTRDSGVRDTGAIADSGRVDTGTVDTGMPVDAAFEDAMVIADAAVDAGIVEDAEVVDAEEPPPVLLYGIPPPIDGGE